MAGALLVILMLLPVTVLAQPAPSVGSGSTAPECQGARGCLEALGRQNPFQGVAGSSIIVIVSTIIKTFLSLLSIIFIGMILFAGYNWMTAMGDKEKVTRAKDTLVSAVIGLVLLIAAYAITIFVINSLTQSAVGL